MASSNLPRGLLAFRWPLFGLGLLLAVGGLSAAIYEGSRVADRPILHFPLAIAISAENEIFVFTDWSRIRVFSSDGRELRSWRVNTRGGMVALAFERPDVLSVVGARTRMVQRFSLEGTLLSEVHDPLAYTAMRSSNLSEAAGPSGETYRINEMSITMRDPDGNERIIVPAPPPILAPFLSAAPDPTLVAAFGISAFLVGSGLVALRARWTHPPER